MAVEQAEPLIAPPPVVTGTVERIAFRNDDTGYAVLRVKVSKRGEPVTMVGSVPPLDVGEFVRAEGRWEEDASWGRQFRVASLTTQPPTTEEGIEAYLASGVVKGIGKNLAKRLIARFGASLLDVLDQDPARLKEVSGVGPKLIERIRQAWAEQRAVRGIMMFLHAHGLGAGRAKAVYDAYGNGAIERIREDPYRLARDIRGIGFTLADQLAAKLGQPEVAPPRLRAGLDHALLQALENGDLGLPKERLIDRAADILGVERTPLDEALDQAIPGGSLKAEPIGGEPHVFAGPWYEIEKRIADRLIALAAAPVPWAQDDLPAKIQKAGETLETPLSVSQTEALNQALASKVTVITGGPGTGKTTLVKALLAALPLATDDVLLAAPTGRAARRLADSSGRPAKTLHRLLEAEPGRGFRRDAVKPLEAKMVIVDESSMIDVSLMDALLLALPDHAALVLVGDVDQLPSIGPGHVLGDIIASDRFATVHLTEIFRQARESMIVAGAHAVNGGILPDLGQAGAARDLFAIRVRNAEDAETKLLELVRERIPGRFGLEPFEQVQVLCPSHRGRAGTKALNEVLRQTLNPNPVDTLERYGALFAAGDKIMQIENDYDRDVYNGDLGRIERIDRDKKEVTIEIDGRSLTYPFDKLDALAPAYATTVHKAQGSEYPAVILLLMQQHRRMLRRNLVYTAMTRARQLLVLLVEGDVLDQAIARTERPRVTRLAGLLSRTASNER
ncbi:MAG: ATP-dependent RecD-like DNA helicase [Geminicoccaceae bacterium]